MHITSPTGPVVFVQDFYTLTGVLISNSVALFIGGGGMFLSSLRNDVYLKQITISESHAVGPQGGGGGGMVEQHEETLEQDQRRREAQHGVSIRFVQRACLMR